MKINTQTNTDRPAPQTPRIVMATNIKRETEVIDRDGNVIDPRTKQIIRRNNEKTQ